MLQLASDLQFRTTLWAFPAQISLLASAVLANNTSLFFLAISFEEVPSKTNII
jgi:hypothetical protein